MRLQRNITQMKKQDKTSKEQLCEVNIGNLLKKKKKEKEPQSNDTKIIYNLWKRMEALIEKMQEIFNKELEELNKKQQQKDTIIKKKYTRGNH